MPNPIRRLLPRAETHLLLARDASQAASTFSIEGVRLYSIPHTTDPFAAALDAFAVAQGFPAGWTADMIQDGAVATLAVDASTDASLAMGWATSQPFHVEEIAATIDPAGGAYLFGDFVAPASRGRGLQRLLVAERLRAAPATHACTIVHPLNLASLRSYGHEGFAVTDRFTRYRWLRQSWARVAPAAESSRIRVELWKQDQLVVRSADRATASEK